MSKLIDARHETRTTQAREEGFHAGQQYTETAQQLCDPGEWTEERKADWIDMLTWLGTCPYLPCKQPYTDAPGSQNAFYARQWQLSFEQGKHKREAELRREIKGS